MKDKTPKTVKADSETVQNVRVAVFDEIEEETKGDFQEAEKNLNHMGETINEALAVAEALLALESVKPFHPDIERIRAKLGHLNSFRHWVANDIGRIRNNLTGEVEHEAPCA